MKLAKQEIYFGRQFTIADTLERIDEVAPAHAARGSPSGSSTRRGPPGPRWARPRASRRWRRRWRERRRRDGARPRPRRTRGPRPRPAALPERARRRDGPARGDRAATCVLAPGERALVSTGIALAIPAGYEGQVRPRSGLALREGITLLNAPGTIDADYRGTVRLVVVNHGAAPVTIRRGERLAQLVIARVERAALEVGRRAARHRRAARAASARPADERGRRATPRGLCARAAGWSMLAMR